MGRSGPTTDEATAPPATGTSNSAEAPFEAQLE
jgi:hypothetical protein